MTTTRHESLRARLDRATKRHDILDHPFYRAWVEGTLTPADLGVYAAQYRHHIDAFTGYLGALAGRLEGTAQRAVADNLADERDGDHLALWDRFAGAVGAHDARRPTPETKECVRTFAEGCEHRPVPFALGMIYGYESQTPSVATTKLQGLRERYGLDGAAVSYFDLHAQLDIEHSASLAAAIASTCRDESDLAVAEAGAEAGAAAVWKLLDGVERERAVA